MLGKESKQNYLKIQIIIETYEGLFPELVVTTNYKCCFRKSFSVLGTGLLKENPKMFIYSLVEI